MRRGLLLLGVAWLGGACSSSGDGDDGVASAGAGGSAHPMPGSAAGSGAGAATVERPAPAALVVESVSPRDAASEVALDAVIEIHFGAALDPATATASSVLVQGPNGPLPGELTVAGEVVRFAPASPLPLLTPIRVSLSTALTSAEGGPLGEPFEAHFLSRDGAFREPRQIDVGAAASLFLRGNDAGDLIATWTDLQVVSSVEAMVFDAESGAWSAAQPIEDDDQLAFRQPVAAVAPNGDSIVAWQGGGWTRYTGQWGSARVGAGIALPRLALGSDAALAVSNTESGASYQVLPNGSSDWTDAQTLLMAGRVDAVDALARGFIAVGEREGTLVAAELAPAGGAWSEFVSLAEVQQLGRVQLATQGDAAAVAWVDLREPPATDAGASDALSRVTHPAARVLTGDVWSPALELPEGAELPSISVATGGRALAVWSEVDAIRASSYSPDQGWTEPQQLAQQSQLSPTGAVDDAGNLLALWPSSEKIAVQRKPAGQAWQTLDALDSLVSVALWSHVDRQGRVSVVWQNGSGIWWTRFE